jgi:hypothetical protein
LNELLDGTLTGPSGDLVERHLTDCARCATRRDELERTIALMRNMPVIEPGKSFEIQPSVAPARVSTARFQGVLTPAFPVLRVAVAAVFLLLVGVTAVDLGTQRDDQDDQVAMIANTPTARTDSISMEAPESTEAAPAAPAVNIEAADADDAALTEPSEAFSQAEVADEEAAGPEREAVTGGGDAAVEQAVASPEVSPTATPEEERLDARDDDDELSNWRIAEIALLLLLFWLVVTWIGLERVRKR